MEALTGGVRADRPLLAPAPAAAQAGWAPTIDEALQRMVEDRRTDITLEQLEQTIGGDEDDWRNA